MWQTSKLCLGSSEEDEEGYEREPEPVLGFATVHTAYETVNIILLNPQHWRV
jgi:hypothetical protein